MKPGARSVPSRSLLSDTRDLEGVPAWRAFGFRLFFGLGALLALGWMPLWIAMYRGVIANHSHVGPVEWHSHEMIFGYALAIVAGFLLTAVRSWTSQPTLHGWPLVGLVLLWLAGRVVMLIGAQLPAWLPAAVELAFVLALTVAVGWPLARARNRRNYGFVPLLLLLGACNLEFHLRALGVIDQALSVRATTLALDCVALIILIVGGRIIPGFTRNVVGEALVRQPGRVDLLGLWAAVVAVGLWAAAPGSLASAIVLALAGALNLGRAWGWGGSATAKVPLLWVMHLAWICVALGLIARAFAALSPALSASAATHVLTVGGIGLMTLGMMARVALGHTGRPLQLRPVVSVAFVLMLAAALVRVLVPTLWPAFYLHGLELAAALWSLAFLLYLLVYAPILLGPRADGRPG